MGSATQPNRKRIIGQAAGPRREVVGPFSADLGEREKKRFHTGKAGRGHPLPAGDVRPGDEKSRLDGTDVALGFPADALRRTVPASVGGRPPQRVSRRGPEVAEKEEDLKVARLRPPFATVSGVRTGCVALDGPRGARPSPKASGWGVATNCICRC